MRVLITGVCGFVGSALAESLLERVEGIRLEGIDNLMRPGTEINRLRLRRLGVEIIHGDLRSASDLAGLPQYDWIVDAAANPSVLAGLKGVDDSRRLLEHNLYAVGNVLALCARNRSGLILVSSSRVYSLAALTGIPLRVESDRFNLDLTKPLPAGLSAEGIGPKFSTEAPISLYGATKLASEVMALEFGYAFDFPVWITRCGVLAGAGQFGTPDQGILSFWINGHLRRRNLRYIGFGGKGYQTRDAFHPRDLATLVLAQMNTPRRDGQRVYTAGGGPANSISLAQLTNWCNGRFARLDPEAQLDSRPYDVAWVAMDNSDVKRDFGWQIEMPLQEILGEIAAHAEKNPDWLELSGL